MKEKILASVLLIGLAIAARLLPLSPNFTPLAAIALIAGIYLGGKWAVALPLLALLASDFFIGFYGWRLLLAVYGSFALIGVFSFWLRKNKSLLNLFIASCLSSFLFFVITNAAVWYFSSWYSHDLNGLFACFVAALPFWRNTLLGNIFYSSLLYGVGEFVRVRGWRLNWLPGRIKSLDSL